MSSNPTIKALNKTFMNKKFRVVNNYETGLDEGAEYRISYCEGKDLNGIPYFVVARTHKVVLLLTWLEDKTIMTEVK